MKETSERDLMFDSTRARRLRVCVVNELLGRKAAQVRGKERRD